MSQSREKILVIMRHGHSPSIFESGVSSDEERPLSERGEFAAGKAALLIKNIHTDFDEIITSPMLRAQQTAKIMSAAFNTPVTTERVLNGNHSPEEIWGLLREKFAAKNTIIVVGHQPVSGILAGVITGEEHISLQPAGFVLIKLPEQLPLQLKYRCAADRLIIANPQDEVIKHP